MPCANCSFCHVFTIRLQPRCRGLTGRHGYGNLLLTILPKCWISWSLYKFSDFSDKYVFSLVSFLLHYLLLRKFVNHRFPHIWIISYVLNCFKCRYIKFASVDVTQKGSQSVKKLFVWMEHWKGKKTNSKILCNEVADFRLYNMYSYPSVLL